MKPVKTYYCDKLLYPKNLSPVIAIANIVPSTLFSKSSIHPQNDVQTFINLKDISPQLNDSTPGTLEFQNEIDDDGFGPGYGNGGVTVVPLFGTPPYTYLWTDDLGVQYSQTSDVLTGVYGPSDWHVEVTDSVGQVLTGTWHVYRAAYEQESVQQSSNFNFRPLNTTQTNQILGIPKFDSTLGTLLGVTFGYSTMLVQTFFACDPAIRTNNTSASTRSILTEFSQVAEFTWNSSIIKTLNFSRSATNSILGNFYALPTVGSSSLFTVGEIPENTDQPTLDAVTGTGDVTGLVLKSYVPVVTLTVTFGSPTPVPTWSYLTTVSQPRPQIFGIVYVKYRYLVPRE